MPIKLGGLTERRSAPSLWSQALEDEPTAAEESEMTAEVAAAGARACSQLLWRRLRRPSLLRGAGCGDACAA